MKIFVFAFLVAFAHGVFIAPLTEEAIQVAFKEFQLEYGKEYSLGVEDVRYAIFKSNYIMINEHNLGYLKGESSYYLGINQFADMTHEEFRQIYLGGSRDPQFCSATKNGSFVSRVAREELPESIDWREHGIVTDVKDQKSCGSCWAFSTIAAVEAHYTKANGKTVLLSEQQLVDCAGDFDNHGCSGGLPSHAFEYIRYNGGIDSADAYPYEGKDNKCRFNPDAVAATVKHSVNITEGDEDELAEALATVGPISIAYQVASDFKFYAGGIYDSNICKSGPMDVNHAVLAVGYDVDSTGKPYYMVKNSWGKSWGIKGYFHIVRGKNMCGLATCSSYPEL